MAAGPILSGFLNVASTVTKYSLAENKGNADIYTGPAAGGAARELTATSLLLA